MNSPEISAILLKKKIKRKGATVTESVEFVAARSGISEKTLWNYLGGKIPKKIPKLAALAEACECHPSELLTIGTKQIYELLLYEAEQILLDDSDFTERSLHVARVSREIRMWEKFFQTGDFGDDDREVGAAQEQTEELMMPEGADPLTDKDE